MSGIPAHKTSSISLPGRVAIVVGFSPGGPSDVLARTLGDQMGGILGRGFDIDGRPGEGGNLAAEFVARARPDGGTLLLGNNSILAANQALYPRINFDPVRDFAPIGLIGSQANILVVNPGLRVTTLEELIVFLKKRPGELSFSSTGHGAAAHLTAEQFKTAAGVDLRHLVHKGAPAAVNDVVTGRADMMFATAASVVEPIKAGLLRALAVTSQSRIGIFPDIPTLREMGLGNSRATTWHGLVAPADTPEPVVDMLNKALAGALTNARDILTDLGIEIGGGSPQEFASYIGEQRREWNELVRTSGASLA